jgi:hypothetical protein
VKVKLLTFHDDRNARKSTPPTRLLKDHAGVEFADQSPCHDTPIPMKPTSDNERTRWRPSPLLLNVLTALIGIVTLLAGIGWLVYTWIVHLEVPYFAIPLVLTVPVIAAVAFRNCWD